MADAFLLSAVRTPPDRIDEVIRGNVLQAGVGQNPLDVVATCQSLLHAARLAGQSVGAGRRAKHRAWRMRVGMRVREVSSALLRRSGRRPRPAGAARRP